MTSNWINVEDGSPLLREAVLVEFACLNETCKVHLHHIVGELIDRNKWAAATSEVLWSKSELMWRSSRSANVGGLVATRWARLPALSKVKG